MKKILAFILCFVLVFALAGVLEAKTDYKNQPQCDMEVIDSKISGLLNEINSNTQYLEFIGDSEYDSVKAVLNKKSYYFIYADNQVKQVEVANQDFTIKLNCNELNRLIQNYEDKDPKFKKRAISQIPLGVKINLINQCMSTKWCKEQVF
jgi:hypothetical protein